MGKMKVGWHTFCIYIKDLYTVQRVLLKRVQDRLVIGAVYHRCVYVCNVPLVGTASVFCVARGAIKYRNG